MVLSEDAQCILFGMLRKAGSTMHFVMIDNKPTARARAAFDELENEGLVKIDPGFHGRMYERTDKPAPEPTIAAAQLFEGAKFPLAEPINEGLQ